MLKMTVTTHYQGRKYKAGETVEVDEATTKRWIAGKIAEAVEDEVPGLDDMTVAGLKEYAAAKGIDIGAAEKKAEILQAIKDAEAE